MRSFVLSFVLFALPFFAVAQERERQEHFIEVTTSAEEEIEPNEIYTVIRLSEFEANREKSSLEKIDSDFLNALRKAGIDRKRLELADIGSKLDSFRRRDKASFRSKTYQIKLTSAAELEKLLTNLETVDVAYVDITRVVHSDYDKLMLNLKVKALQEARAKAETLLQSIGAEIGKPIQVRDWDIRPYDGMARQTVMMRSEAAADTEPIGFRKIKLQAQITAQFQIK